MKKQTILKRMATYLSLFAFTAMLMGFISTAKADVSQVKVVTVTQNGSPIAVFYNQGGSWVEIGLTAQGSVRELRETQRDEWSIYLADAVITLQLDLFQKQVNYNDVDGKSIPGLYQVMAFHN